MSTDLPNNTSVSEECRFLYDSTWQKSYLTNGTYRNLVAITSINVIAVLPTIMLNALVIIAVAAKPRLRTPSNHLLASMAGTDLFIGLVVQPLAIVVQVKRILGDGPFCTLESVYKEFRISADFIAFSLLVSITVDRYIAIKNPLRYRDIVTKKRIKTAVILILAISAFFSNSRLCVGCSRD